MSLSKSQKYCQQAILDTLSYRAVFAYPMSSYQLATFLISKEEISTNAIRQELKRLIKIGAVSQKGGKYFLSGVTPIDWELRMAGTKAVLAGLDFVFKSLGRIPWVLFIGVTGTMAVGNGTGKDDVDVFIITTRGRAWLTRLFVVILLKVCGCYRSDIAPAGKICPNIFVDEQNTAWDKTRQNLYTAHEIVMMRPVFDRRGTYFKFLSANKWVFDYFGNFKGDTLADDVATGRHSRLIDQLEALLMRLQLFYMKNRKTVEVTTRGLIHFNRDDSTKRILSAYGDLCSQKPKVRRFKMRRPRQRRGRHLPT